MIEKIIKLGQKTIKSAALFTAKLFFVFIVIEIFNSFVSDWNNHQFLTWILGLIILVLWGMAKLSSEVESINEPLLEKLEELKDELEGLKDEIEDLKKSLQPEKDCQWI